MVEKPIIYILDEKLNVIASINNFIKMTWTENFFEADSFAMEINFDITSNVKNKYYEKNKMIFEALDSMYQKNIFKPRFVVADFFQKDKIRIAMIDSFHINETNARMEINALGMLSIFQFKYAYNKEYIPSENSDDNIGIVACRILADGFTADKILKNIFVADESSNKIGSEVFYQTEDSQNIYEATTALLCAFNIGFETIYNHNEKKIFFNTINSSGKIIDIAISADDENLIENKYTFEFSEYRNYIFIEGENSINEVIDKSDGSAIFSIKSKSKSKQGALSNDAYRQILKTEATIELDKNSTSEHFDISINDDVDVALGDTCVVKIFVGYKEIIKQILITSIEHEFEEKKYNRNIGFGKPYNAKNQLKKTLGVL